MVASLMGTLKAVAWTTLIFVACVTLGAVLAAQTPPPPPASPIQPPIGMGRPATP